MNNLIKQEQSQLARYAERENGRMKSNLKHIELCRIAQGN